MDGMDMLVYADQQSCRTNCDNSSWAPNLAMSIHVRRQNLSLEALVYIDTLLAETLSIVVILGKFEYSILFGKKKKQWLKQIVKIQVVIINLLLGGLKDIISPKFSLNCFLVDSLQNSLDVR